jgi:hypothetical protein
MLANLASNLSQLRKLQSRAMLLLPRSKYICMQTTAFSNSALQMHGILERNVASVCTTWFKNRKFWIL